MDHPELFRQYPELRNVQLQVSINPNLKDGGQFGFGIIQVQGPNVKSIRDTIIHEIQHVIQDIEGFAKGGSSNASDVKAVAKRLGISDDAAYRRLFGEFEARDSASRMTWGPQERKVVRPYSSEMEPPGGWEVR